MSFYDMKNQVNTWYVLNVNFKEDRVITVTELINVGNDLVKKMFRPVL